ncbi:VC0807 family protein [Saccharopolyspora rosea]|uniref:VC0807 family protein n=1 Tax=Saccharopolyspora rosea TaxID=524884 RepID=UPI0021DA314F|nr:VC0807 family protein [Saccharopolyspora rosea]
MNPEFRMALPFLLDLAMPTVAYYVLHGLWGWSPVVALTAGGLLTAGHALTDAVRHRRANTFTVLVVFMIALSTAVTWLTGDARFALAKPAVFTAIAGAYCLGTCLVGRPLTFETAKPFTTGGDPRRLAGWEHAWQRSPDFRRALALITIAWGCRTARRVGGPRGRGLRAADGLGGARCAGSGRPHGERDPPGDAPIGTPIAQGHAAPVSPAG